MARLYKRDKYYYIDYFVDGKRKRLSLNKRNIITLADAKKFFAAFENELRNETLKSAGIKTTKSIYVSDAIEEYILKCSTPYKTERTVILDKIILGKHFNELYHDKLIKQIQKKHIENYIRHRSNIVHNITINREIQLLKCFFDQCIEWGYTTLNPLDNISKFKIEKNEPEILTNEEQNKLLKTCDSYIKLAIEVALYTGMRKSEILNLRWEDINFDKRNITVRCNEGFLTKSKEFRQIPINEKLFNSLIEYRENKQNGFIFVSKDSSKGFIWDFKKPFKNALKQAGIERNLRFHDLRHTFISNLIMKGIDILTVSRLAGHKSTRMIDQVYGHLRDDHLRNAVEQL